MATSSTREDVLTILNEREPVKLQWATELENQLKARGYKNNRIKPCKNLAKLICERNPQVLVLDYLLGDVATALDVMHEINLQSSSADKISTIVWTDEPSVNVAVSAMKLGAIDYIEINSPSSIERLLENIDRTIKNAAAVQPISAAKRRLSEFETPIAQDKHSIALLQQASGVANRAAQISVIYAPQGAGRNTVARYIHKLRAFPGAYVELELDSWPEDIAVLTGGQEFRGLPLLSYGATVFVDHAEFDTGELLESVARRKKMIWQDEKQSPMLIVGTSSEAAALTWKKEFDADLIEIPALSARAEDFLPLIQRFFHIAQQFPNAAKTKFSSDLLQHLKKLSWPGNVRELKAVTIEAITCNSPETTEGGSLLAPDEEAQLTKLLSSGANIPKEQRELLASIIKSKMRWEKFQSQAPLPVDASLARRVFDDSAGNLRLAAISLGTGIPQLRKALYDTPKA